VKVLKADCQEDALAIELLQREAFVAQQVLNSHLASVLSAHVDRSPRYLVFPFLEGVTVRNALQAVGHVGVPHALWIARQVTSALDALHGCGWLHGDIKPENVLIAKSGHATLLDLGLARSLRSPSSQRDVLAGSLAYAPPEAFNPNVPFSPASDIYSLGILLFEMLTGRRPFAEQDAVELAAAHLVKPAPDPRCCMSQIPASVARLVRRMLAKEPLRRPATAELHDLLAASEIETFELRACG